MLLIGAPAANSGHPVHSHTHACSQFHIQTQVRVSVERANDDVGFESDADTWEVVEIEIQEEVEVEVERKRWRERQRQRERER